jgi:DNA end-binding protein Ku
VVATASPVCETSLQIDVFGFGLPPSGDTTDMAQKQRMPRSLWTGSISFGLVNVPVRVYSAVHEHKLRFHLVHAKDDGPIGYEKICKVEDKPVPNDEIVKAFEYRKGELVQMTDEDFEAAQVEGQHTIDLEDFVPYEEIDPTFFAHAYLVGPQEGAERPYSLLVRAMEESGLAGIGKFVMRNRQYLGCLHVRNGSLTLEQLYFADEVDPPETILPAKLPNVDKRELDMASRLIESFSSDWKPQKYEDTYTDALMAVVKQKRKGQEVHRVQEPEEEGPPDLLEALRLSLDQSKGGRSRRNGRRGNGAAATKEELQEQARKLGIEGRSKMSKAQLAKALASAK